MDNLRLIITTINKTFMDAHIIDIEENKYIKGFCILGTYEQMINKINIIKESYEINETIIDEQSISSSMRSFFKEAGWIS